MFIRIRIASRLVLLLFNLAIGPSHSNVIASAPSKYDCRHIDSARAYKNEAQVGEAIRDSGLPRQDIFVSVYTLHRVPDRLPSTNAKCYLVLASKINRIADGYQSCLDAIDDSLKNFGLGTAAFIPNYEFSRSQPCHRLFRPLSHTQRLRRDSRPPRGLEGAFGCQERG